jgi:hypothetical protein
MTYLLGMSHAISVLRALTPDADVSHQSWAGRVTQPGFRAVDTPAGEFRVHLIPPSADWRAVIQETDGKRTVAASPGFIELLSTMDVAPDGNTRLVSFLGGNEHSVLSLLGHPQPYDFVWPAGSDAPLLPGHQPLALAVVQAPLAAMLQQTVAQLAMIRIRHPALRIVHVLPPPPHANEASMRASPEVFGGLMDSHGIMPLGIRLKYYGLACELLRAQLAPLNISCLAAPAAACSEDGALLDGYTLGCTHGNEAYGALVAQQLREMD